MKALWLGVFCLSVLWLFALPLYEPPQWGWVIFLALGVAANSMSYRHYEYQSVPRLYAALLAPLALFAALIPWPHNLGAIVLIAAAAIAILTLNSHRSQPVVLGLGISGLVLLAHALIWPAYSHLAARLHNLAVLNSIFAFCVDLLGGKASYSEDGIFIQTTAGVSQLYTSSEALGLFLIVSVALGSLVLLFFSARFFDKVVKLLGILLIYIVFRYVFLLFAFASFETSDIFWQRSWLILSFIPLPFILARFIPIEFESQSAFLPSLSIGWRNSLAFALLSLSVFAAVMAIVFQDPGARKQGRVLFDESRSNWEWMERPYDTEWYGEQSGYNYYNLGQLLKRYYQVEIGKERLTPEQLSRYDVLVLKTPTSPYGAEEIAAVVDFVKAGGGLWLIGDHTNVFGMGTYLNEVAREFGFAFKYDATYDLATGNLSFYKPVGLRHPAINHLPFYMFATSCSLEAPLFSEDVIAGYGLKSVRADYSQKSFFPKDAHTATAIEFGLLLQNAARKFGKGRVMLYTDSTCFSNFYMFMPGKPELALGSIEWLNRRNRYGLVAVLLLGISATLLCIAIVLVRKNDRRELVVLAFAALLLGAPSGILASGEINNRSYPPPRPHSPYPIVAFDAEHSRYYLPATEFKTVESDMQTFYVWTQRLGLFPDVRYKFVDCLKESDAVVIINPAREFTQEEIARFVEYIENGGKALLMDDPRNILQSTAHQLLRPFRVAIRYQEIPQGIVEDEHGNAIWQGEHLGAVEGGQPYLFVKPVLPEAAKPAAEPASLPAKVVTQENVLPRPDIRQPIMSIAKRGQGVVAVLGNSTMFTSGTMGPTAIVPDDNRRKIYDLEFRIFRDLLKVPME